MHFTIRKASPDDKDAIIEVLQAWNMHHPFFKEPEHIDLSRFFVAIVSDAVVGVAGYEPVGKKVGKTRLLAVYPEFQGSGIGKALQNVRLEAMYAEGFKTIQTHADRPNTILWYKKHYDYRETGSIKKSFPISLTDVDHATVLELDLDAYMQDKKGKEQARLDYIAAHDPHPLAPYSPLIINVALTGMIPTKRLTPHVPTTPEEIIQDAIKVHDAGASIVHLHARDEKGKPTSDARFYEMIIAGIRQARPQLICCATTSGRDGQNVEKRSEILHVTGAGKPDMASLTLGSLNFLSGPSVNSLETIQRLALLMKEKEIKPELEVFDSGMINAAKYLERHNIISGTKYFNILLGNLNTAPASLGELAHLSSSLPENSLWAVAGLGAFQLPMNAISIAAGGHVRVGLEDNCYSNAGKTQLVSNEMLVKRIVRLAGDMDREIATPAATREMLGIPIRKTG